MSKKSNECEVWIRLIAQISSIENELYVKWLVEEDVIELFMSFINQEWISLKTKVLIVLFASNISVSSIQLLHEIYSTGFYNCFGAYFKLGALSLTKELLFMIQSLIRNSDSELLLTMYEERII